VNAPQPCGACGKPVPSGRGRAPGETWWHSSVACRASRDHARYASRLRAAGQPEPRPASTCQRCGRPYRPQLTDPLIPGICSQPACRAERALLYGRVRIRALGRLAREHPDRMRELVAEEAARVVRGGG
jgi:hypothetical protein